MNELPALNNPNKQERTPLYPRRVFETIAEDAKEIRDLLETARNRPPIPEKEMLRFRMFEERLGERLERIDDLVSKETVFFIDYLASDTGRNRFREVFGLDIPDTGSGDDISVFLLNNRSKILDTKPKDRSDFAGESRKYEEEQILDALKATMDASGKIDTRSADIPDPERVMLLDPEKCLEKITRLRAFKNELRQYRDQLKTSETADNERELIEGTIDLYAARTNEILINTLASTPSLTKKRKLLGESSLTEEERELLSQSSSRDNVERNLSRLDQIIHGSATHEGRWSKQIGAELEVLADRIEQKSLDSVVFAEQMLQEKSLDPRKIRETNLSPDSIREMAEEMISAYDLLSIDPPETYNPDRKTPASDDRWQFVQRKGRKTFGVIGKKKVLLGPNTSLPVKKVLPILQHESAHILQHENKNRLPLRLFRKISGGRWSAFAECAAMEDQARVNHEMFGTAEKAHPHYIRAMKRRHEGGTYLDCVQAFHDSALRKIAKQKESGVFSSTEEVRRESETMLSESINRVFRLFPGAANTGTSSGILFRTKDTAYLEQTEVFEAFQSQGIGKLLYIGGANADTLKFLARTGLLRLEDIREPKLHALDIWKRIQDRYMKDETDTSA